MDQTKQVIALYRSSQHLACMAFIYAILAVWMVQLGLEGSLFVAAAIALAGSFFMWGYHWWQGHVQALAIEDDKLEVYLPAISASQQGGWVKVKLDKIYVFSLVVRVVGQLPSGKRLVISLFGDSLAPAANARFRRWAIERQQGEQSS